MSRDLSRRAFLERASLAGALLMVGRPAAAADGMYVSLNGSLTRQMPWPDFVRLAGKLGYGGVDVNLNAAKTDGVDATLALFKEMRRQAGGGQPAVAVRDARRGGVSGGPQAARTRTRSSRPRSG